MNKPTFCAKILNITSLKILSIFNFVLLYKDKYSIYNYNIISNQLVFQQFH
jgi:hypothetical protein